MKNVTLEQLLEAGAHFGHQVTRQNPKARDYVFEARDNIHIIDLGKTKEGLDEAAAYVRDLAKKGGSMIILGAKRQAEPVVKDEAKRAKEAGVDGLYFVTNRWIGGILTNFPEVSKNFKRLRDLVQVLADKNARQHHTKKELSLMDKERAKLESFYWGVQDMTKIPDAVFIIDTHMEDLAVREAMATNLTTVGITDTNADPTIIDYPIPANDDAVGSVQLILGHIVDAWIEGRAAKTTDTQEEKPATDKKETPKKDTKKEETVKQSEKADDKAGTKAAEKEVTAKTPSKAVTEKKAQEKAK